MLGGGGGDRVMSSEKENGFLTTATEVLDEGLSASIHSASDFFFGSSSQISVRETVTTTLLMCT